MLQVARPVAPMQSSLGILRTTFLTLGAIGVAASLLAGCCLPGRRSDPSSASRSPPTPSARRATSGSASPSRPGRRRDEVGRLTEELNRMLAQLQAAYERVEAANGQLEIALAAQRRFVADASHELRTPLTSLRGNVDLLQRMAALGDPLADGDEAEQLLADMAAETERVARLVADLLLLAQADAASI